METKLITNLISIMIGIFFLIISYAFHATWIGYIISFILILIGVFNAFLLFNKPYQLILFKEGSEEILKICEASVYLKSNGGIKSKFLKIEGFKDHALEKWTSLYHAEKNNSYKSKVLFGYTNGIDITPFQAKLINYVETEKGKEKQYLPINTFTFVLNQMLAYGYQEINALLKPLKPKDYAQLIFLIVALAFLGIAVLLLIYGVGQMHDNNTLLGSMANSIDASISGGFDKMSEQFRNLNNTASNVIQNTNQLPPITIPTG
jgi:hypothetical protein